MAKQKDQFNKGEIIIYQPKTGGPRLEVTLVKNSLETKKLRALYGNWFVTPAVIQSVAVIPAYF